MLERYYYRLKDYYYVHKNWIKNCFKYRTVLTETYDFDYNGTLLFMKTHFAGILDAMKKGYFLQEDKETRVPKERELLRVITLIDNITEDDYADRCGYDNDFESDMVEDSDPNYYTSTSNQTDEQRINNTKAIQNGVKLQDKEWKEFIKLLSKMRGWWI
jgi:hypothetical protein